jgi:hypothetical protein
MSQTSSNSFQELFNDALDDFEKQTGIRLVEHPFAKQLEACVSVDSITSTLQDQVQTFREFRDSDDGKIMKSMKFSVDVLYKLSTSIIFTAGIGLIVHIQIIYLGYLVPNRHSTAVPAC